MFAEGDRATATRMTTTDDGRGKVAVRIGEFLVSTGRMTQEQVDLVLQMQREGNGRRFGEIALALGFIDNDAVKRFVDYLEKPEGSSP